jgi:glyoxylase-like metal-dependent hydrolase (beta-lactamase superfamily II)
VEMKDHLVVIEGPQNDARTTAVIAEVKKAIPNKPIKYVVNSHSHFGYPRKAGHRMTSGR